MNNPVLAENRKASKLVSSTLRRQQEQCLPSRDLRRYDSRVRNCARVPTYSSHTCCLAIFSKIPVTSEYLAHVLTRISTQFTRQELVNTFKQQPRLHPPSTLQLCEIMQHVPAINKIMLGFTNQEFASRTNYDGIVIIIN